MSDIDKILRAAQTIQSWVTSDIMKTFEELGSDLGYQVDRWFYDMIWYIDELQYTADKQQITDRFITRVPMILESELNKSHFDIDGDFHKLMLGRADVRVWITRCHGAELHIRNCKQQIQAFCGTKPGDQYVLAVYDRDTKQSRIEPYTVPLPIPQSK